MFTFFEIPVILVQVTGQWQIEKYGTIEKYLATQQ